MSLTQTECLELLVSLLAADTGHRVRIIVAIGINFSRKSEEKYSYSKLVKSQVKLMDDFLFI